MTYKTGLLGGTFNPIHRGHIEAGLQLQRMFGIDRILYILAARPPHKKNQYIAAEEIRWRMLQQALAPYPGLIPCDVELNRSGESWTIDTLGILSQQFPADLFYFVSGSDGFLTMPTWKRYREILQTVIHIIILRQAQHEQAVVDLLRAEGIPQFVTMDRAITSPPAAFICSYGSPYLGLSSTAIRDRLQRGQAVGDAVDPGTEAMLEELKLYGT